MDEKNEEKKFGIFFDRISDGDFLGSDVCKLAGKYIY